MRTLSIAAAVAAVCAASLLHLPVAAADPGAVEGVQALPAAATPPDAARTERLLYDTTTARDEPTVASAAVYFPPGAPPAGGWPVIAWAHGTVGLGDSCAYSVGGPAAVDRDWAYLGTWLRQGYAIVAADYAGLGTPGEHPYLDGVVEAHNVVDAVKAATRSHPELSAKWAVVGQSQGAGAAVTTARYATEFGGPELDYRGGVATGTPAYIEDILMPLGPGMPPVALSPHSTAYLLYILNGLRTAHPELNIESFLTDSGRYWLERARTECLMPLGEALGARHVVAGTLFAEPLTDIPDLHGLLASYLGLPESGYDRPLFLGQGLADTDVITPETLRFAAALTADRQPVTLHTYPTDHNGTVNASLPDSIPFVRNLFG
ncbi:lipase family protein [Nocardia terpenica]|uniref:Lipase n=1 Tax=Nocardia terpenica TaxID=455432 RepID=A0A291RTS4_9NOCA|nr:lipase family protein [Nocardia terpenica]ATL70991.1 lipase [Nocardia terpenica]